MVRQFIEAALGLGLNEIQKKYYEKLLKDCKDTPVVPLREVLTEEEYQKVLKMDFKIKECYRNAFLFQEAFLQECDYVEGQFVDDIGIPIDHAWNKIRGKYVDVTYELVLKKSLDKVKYTAFGHYNALRTMHVIVETGYYGGVYLYYNARCSD